MGLTLQISNPIRDTQVGWFDIDAESLDGYDVKHRSFSFGLLGCMNLKESALRIRMNYTRIDLEESQSNSDGTNVSSLVTTGKQNKFTLAPGVAWSVRHERLNLYVGFELPVTLHGSYILSTDEKKRLADSGEITFDNYYTSEIPAGFSIGLAGLIGFDYSIKRTFSFGLEYSPSLQYVNLGGEVKQSTRQTVPDPIYNTGTLQDSTTGFTLLEHRFSLGVTYWFH
jgi:hypothetical protein